MSADIPMPYLELLILSAVTVWAICLCWFDLRIRKLPNALTVSALAVVLVARWGYGGLPVMLDGLFGAGGAFLFLILPFITRAAGGGDVKMLAAGGAIIGIQGLMLFLWITSLAGLVFALGMLLCRGVNGARTRHLFNVVFNVKYDRAKGLESLPAKDNEKNRIPFSIPIAFGLLSTMLFMSV